MKWGIIGGLIILVIIIVLLQGCAIQGGLSVHSASKDYNQDEPMPNPLGIIRGVRKTAYGEGFCEHISSIGKSDDDYGLNHCGFLIDFY